jgi:hypothetical protein
MAGLDALSAAERSVVLAELLRARPELVLWPGRSRPAC